MKRWIIGAVVVLVLFGIAFGIGALLQLRERMDGPELPVCSAPALVRKGFEPPIRLMPSEGETFAETAATLLPDGSIVVAAIANSGLAFDNRLMVGRIPLDGPPQLRSLRSDRKKAYDPWLTTDASGTAHLVWLGHDSGSPEKRMQVAHASTQDGLTWSAPREVHAPSDCPGEVKGCLDKPMAIATGDGLSLFYFSVPNGNALKYTRLEGDARPQASTPLTPEGVFGHLAVDSKGREHVAYVHVSAAARTVYGDLGIWVDYARSDDGGRTFSAPVRVSEQGKPTPFFFSSAQVAADPERGFVYVAYPSGGEDMAWQITLATSTDEGRTWRYTQVNDDAPCANHAMTMMAVDPTDGAVHLAWYENRSGQGGVAYARCAPGGERCEPNEAVSDPFASYKLGRHGDDWLGDYGTMVIDAQRGWLHLVWTQPVLVEGDPLSRVFYGRRRLR